MEKKRIVLDTHESFASLRDLLENGWERADVPYNPYGTEGIRLMELVKYTPEEKAIIEATKAGAKGPLQPVDVNCLTVPIISYADENSGRENPYKNLAAKGWAEVHRTSSVAVMKLTDPRGIRLSDEDLGFIINALESFPTKELVKAPWMKSEGTPQLLVMQLQTRLLEILKDSESAKAPIPEPQPQ